ncbi:MAG: glucose-6-phosphate dehydrogenase [Limisphaerales bacterium]
MTNTSPASNPVDTSARKADPCVMVIFGASGDLTQRKLVPALLNLAAAKLLPEQFAIIGFANIQQTTESYRQTLTESIKNYASCPVTPEMLEWFLKRVYYLYGDIEDPKAFQSLKEEIAKVEKTHNTGGNHFYYLAVAPRFFGEVVRQLGAAGLAEQANRHWARVIIEKPFGRDLESARALNAQIKQILEERQIYRIDHYLGKETVQNILIFRFGNGIFEPIWNRRYIDHVQITAGETVGVEKRGGYYETAGALRDMVPNHLFQLVSLTAMEPPISFHADAVRDEQAKALHAVQIPTPEEVLTMTVRGQYGEGQIGEEHMAAYRAEPGVAADSTTETFAGLKLRIDNWRWADVPFYLRTGKRLASRATEIAIQFKRAPFQLFRDTPVENLEANRLVLSIQPEEGLSLRFGAKIPGPIVHIGAVEMKFNYEDYFGRTPSTGYERLIYDCMTGDATLFQRADMVEAGWSVITPILDVWKALPPRSFPNYRSGSWGPKEADDLLARDGRAWRKIQ